MKRKVDFGLNGKPASLDIDDDRLLLWVLRTELALTGSKVGRVTVFSGKIEMGRAP